MIQTKKPNPKLPGYPIYKIALATAITIGMLVCLVTQIEVLEAEFVIVTISCIGATFVSVLLFALRSKYQKDTRLCFIFLALQGLILLEGYNRRQDYRSAQLAGYGRTTEAEVTEVKKKSRGRYERLFNEDKWNSTFIYFVDGKKFQSNITKKQDIVARRDLVKIKYSSKDPELYEVLEIIKYHPNKDRKLVSVLETAPAFRGGNEALYAFIQQNLTYPKEALQNKVNGTVFLSFVIDKDGAVVDIKVERGIGAGCDEAAVDVLNKMPNWRPGFQNGKAVKVKYNLPIKFSL